MLLAHMEIWLFVLEDAGNYFHFVLICSCKGKLDFAGVS